MIRYYLNESHEIFGTTLAKAYKKTSRIMNGIKELMALEEDGKIEISLMHIVEEPEMQEVVLLDRLARRKLENNNLIIAKDDGSYLMGDNGIPIEF